ncbi:hypothetical protein RHMOL_RhmolUnG0009300 [Rhododendron molle]|nr:hypothetical protein RHMOL_RhmolUnG0009300 [Rhododendron molle]
MLEEHRTPLVSGSFAPLKIRRTECLSRPVVLITAFSKVNSLWSMEQCRQGKSANGSVNFEKDWLEDRHGVPASTRRPSVDRRAAPAARAVVRVRLGTALRGAFPGRRTVNSELCSECQSEEIQPSAGKRRE